MPTNLVERILALKQELALLEAEYAASCKAEWLKVNKPEQCKPKAAPSKGSRRGLFDDVKIKF